MTAAVVADVRPTANGHVTLYIFSVVNCAHHRQLSQLITGINEATYTGFVTISVF